MPRKPFIISFVILAVLFVPVVFDLGLASFIVPACWGIVSMISALVALNWKLALFVAIYTAIYMGTFTLIAYLLDFLARLTRNNKALLVIQIALLLGLVTCSFARVLTHESIQGRGGTYTFWTAIGRLMEKRGG